MLALPRLVCLLAVSGLSLGVAGGSASRAPGGVCAPHMSLAGPGLGAPDDLAVDGSSILFSDEKAEAVGVLRGGRSRVLVRGLSAPEGIVVEPGGKLLVAEQGPDRVTEIRLQDGKRRVVVRIPNTTGRLGIDGLAAAPGGGIYVPDSAHGRLFLFRAGRLTLLARGMLRPVHAIAWGGGVAVADENAEAVWQARAGRLTRLAGVSIPDDLAVFRGALLAVTLGDGALWEIRPRLRRLWTGWHEPQGLAIYRGTVLVADSTTNAIYRLTGLGNCL